MQQEEAASRASAAQAAELKVTCEAELEAGMPALNAALNALKELSKADIAEVKAMKNPPSSVKLTLETVCLMKGIKPEVRRAGKDSLVDFWKPAQFMMADTNFLHSLIEFDKDALSADVVQPR